MVPEKRQPSLHRIWIFRSSADPSRDTPFRDIETQLEQFTMNARCSLVAPSPTSSDRNYKTERHGWHADDSTVGLKTAPTSNQACLALYPFASGPVPEFGSNSFLTF